MPLWNRAVLSAKRVAIGLAALGGSIPAPALAQEPPAIHSRVNLVNVAFTARDSSGALLDSLAADRVRVFEDGVEQRISHFARSTDVPLTLGLIVDASSSQE